MVKSRDLQINSLYLYSTFYVGAQVTQGDSYLVLPFMPMLYKTSYSITEKIFFYNALIYTCMRDIRFQIYVRMVRLSVKPRKSPNGG